MDRVSARWIIGMVKNLYRGCFNYAHEVEIRRTTASSGRQAKIFMMHQLAREHGVSYAAVSRIFDGSKPNFGVELEIEDKEVDDGVHKL